MIIYCIYIKTSIRSLSFFSFARSGLSKLKEKLRNQHSSSSPPGNPSPSRTGTSPRTRTLPPFSPPCRRKKGAHNVKNKRRHLSQKPFILRTDAPSHSNASLAFFLALFLSLEVLPPTPNTLSGREGVEAEPVLQKTFTHTSYVFKHGAVFTKTSIRSLSFFSFARSGLSKLKEKLRNQHSSSIPPGNPSPSRTGTSTRTRTLPPFSPPCRRKKGAHNVKNKRRHLSQKPFILRTDAPSHSNASLAFFLALFLSLEVLPPRPPGLLFRAGSSTGTGL